jgi:hypothetical protein
MGYLWLFFGVSLFWTMGAALLRGMVVTTEPVPEGAFLRYALHGLVVAVIVTLTIFVIRWGA